MRESVWSSLERGEWLLCGNARAARWAREAYSLRQRAAGKKSWPSPRIESLDGWVEGEWRRLGTFPALTREQEHLVWEEEIRRGGDGMEAAFVAAAAGMAASAWDIQIAWRLPEHGAEWNDSDDTAAYACWAQAIRDRGAREGWITAAERMDRLATAAGRGAIRVPQEIWLAGFDRLTPQQNELAEALRRAGATVTQLTPEDSEAALLVCRPADGAEELQWAARWSGQHRKADGVTGVIVPDLAARRSEVEAAFTRVLHPEEPPWTGPEQKRSFHISAGAALARQPLVEAALLLLEAVCGNGRLEAESAYRLLRSPFLERAEQDWPRRARGEIALRDEEWEWLDRDRLSGAGLRIPRVNWPARQSYGVWAASFGKVLEQAGWPGERALDSDEHQALEALRGTFAGLAGLDWVARGQPQAPEALRRLRGIAERQLFQPEERPAPVQIMGWLEAAGLEFARLWICGLDDMALPAPAAPHPFLPLAWQREHGVPRASAADEAAFAARVLERLRRSAGSVIASVPARKGDVKLRPSPLLSAGEVWQPQLAEAAAAAAPALEELADAQGPELQEAERGQLRGGSGILKDQSVCPFRGFAARRLHARPIGEISAGLSPRTRGSLLHKVLREVWAQLRDQKGLHAASAADLRRLVERAAEAVVRGEKLLGQRPALADVERDRLAWQVLRWLEIEKQRQCGFSVLLEEESREVEIAGLRMRIRLDRVDELEGGGRLLIDYKSGDVETEAWESPRPWDPQLPLYMATDPDPERCDGMAFARLKPGSMGFVGHATRADVLPKVKVAPHWREHQQIWRQDLEALAREFQAGLAAVNPKPPLRRACEYCGLQPLCRIEESELMRRESALAEEDAEDGG